VPEPDAARPGYFVPASLVVAEAEPEELDPQPEGKPFDTVVRARALRRAWFDAFRLSPIGAELDGHEDEGTRAGIALHLAAVVDFQSRQLAGWHLAVRQAARAGKPAPDMPAPGYRGPEWRLFYQLDRLNHFRRPAVALPISVLAYARKYGPDMALAQPAVLARPPETDADE
jgi:hypothetical protein